MTSAADSPERLTLAQLADTWTRWARGSEVEAAAVEQDGRDSELADDRDAAEREAQRTLAAGEVWDTAAAQLRAALADLEQVADAWRIAATGLDAAADDLGTDPRERRARADALRTCADHLDAVLGTARPRVHRGQPDDTLCAIGRADALDFLTAAWSAGRALTVYGKPYPDPTRADVRELPAHAAHEVIRHAGADLTLTWHVLGRIPGPAELVALADTWEARDENTREDRRPLWKAVADVARLIAWAPTEAAPGTPVLASGAIR